MRETRNCPPLLLQNMQFPLQQDVCSVYKCSEVLQYSVVQSKSKGQCAFLMLERELNIQ